MHSLSRRWGLGLLGPILTQLHLLFPLGYRLRIRDLHRKDSWMQDQETSRDVSCVWWEAGWKRFTAICPEVSWSENPFNITKVDIQWVMTCLSPTSNTHACMLIFSCYCYVVYTVMDWIRQDSKSRLRAKFAVGFIREWETVIKQGTGNKGEPQQELDHRSSATEESSN